jgi:predicted acyl esterase
MLAALALAAALTIRPAVIPPVPASHEFTIERLEAPIRGAMLSMTLYRPVPRTPGETFPVLLELLPYRKDDSFYARDYPLYSWFARHGYLAAKVDVRGTGSSTGALPAREYSEEEIADAVALIDWLAALPGSNGKVGMWGISWGGFNALQVAMRKPPRLAAILVLHASDDLFHDDVHYIDGALHLDQYALEIDHENGLPRPPGYALDAGYFADRFDREPWLFTYLREQQDGDFWRAGSLRFDPAGLQVPVFAIGGLLDGYRDTVPRLLATAKAPVRAMIGPWGHDWPDNGTPGPNLEWRQEALRWWDHWLKGIANGALDGPPLLLFVRAGHPPDRALTQTPGGWTRVDWPFPGARTERLFPAPSHALRGAPPASSAVERLRYMPGSGTATGLWWGDPTGDLRPDGAGSLVYEGPPLAAPLTIAGFPRVALRAAAEASLAHWVARLEDVQPDGTVALVTGAVLNGAQRASRLAPRPLVPGEVVDLAFDLHFTTWTFQAGHRIRLAVSNALFPMIWPTPYPMTTALHLGSGTFLDLPVLPPGPWPWPPPDLAAPEPREERADARTLPGGGWPRTHRVVRDELTGETSVTWEGESLYQVEDRRFRVTERIVWSTHDDAPARSAFVAEETTQVDLPGRALDLTTRIDLRSDATDFELTVTRTLRENGKPVRERSWREAIPRRMQ